ncbi:MAG TPA: TolC family protein [Thermodesulfobacteriota bacterium]|nr:TolC family protein [Thermodesulfobacteriota bacterium]
MKFLFGILVLVASFDVHVFASEVVTIKSLIEEALMNNPEIKAARAKWEASTKRPSQEGSLPDPMVGATWRNVSFDRITLTEDPDSMLLFSFSQEFPFPGKLSLKEKIATEEAEAEEKGYEAAKRQIIAELKEAYYDWFFVNKSIEVTSKNKGLIEKFVNISETRYEVGEGIQQDVIKAQLEQSKFIEQLEILRQKEGVIEAKIRSILNRLPDSPLGEPEDIEKSPITLTLDELYKIAEENAPVLQSRENIIEREEKALSLAKREYYPDFALEAGPGVMGEEGGGTQGVWEATLEVRVPLYFWRKQRFGVEEAVSELQAAKEEYASTKQDLLFNIKDKYLAAKTSENLLKLYKEGIIPQSRLSLESALSGYQVGAVDFLTLIDNSVNLFNFELEYHRQLVEYLKAIARLEEITGVELRK